MSFVSRGFRGGRHEPDVEALAYCDGGYTTNVPVADLIDGRAWVAFAYDGAT